MALELEEIGIPFYVDAVELSNNDVSNWFTAKNDTWLSRIKVAEENNNHLEKGKCYGYPKSSIENFSEKGIDFGEIEDKITGEYRIGYNISPFKLSKEKWGEELEQCYKWSQILLEHNPRLYWVEELMDKNRFLLRQRKLSARGKRFLIELEREFPEIINPLQLLNFQ